MSNDYFHAEIIALEDATWRALQNSGAALIPFLTSDCVMQFPLGVKLTPTSEPSVQDVLHSSAFVPWRSFELSEMDVTDVGSDAAVVSYRVKATRVSVGRDSSDDERGGGGGGGGVEFHALCCSVWRRERDGGLKMCFHQQTLAR